METTWEAIEPDLLEPESAEPAESTPLIILSQESASVPVRPRKRRRAPEPQLLEHCFWLRPGLCVTFHLPADLKPAEAVRLASMIEVLPFD